METKTLTKIEDSKYFWSKVYPIAYYEVDFKQVLKPSALLNLMQDAATINAELFGFGYSFTYPRNYGWFLVKYHMEFDDYPQELKEIMIKTEARGYSKIIANRDFEIWTSDNKKRLGRASSNWMLVNLETKRPVSLSKEIDFMPAYEKRETDMEFEKITPIEKVDYEKTFEIRYDDIDVNSHVNNANYVIWAFEALPFEFKAQHRLKTLDIAYKKEIAFGHNIVSQVQLDEENETSTHILKNAATGEELCLINAIWQQRQETFQQ
ncbi:MAG: acyl-ACP thioesterase domain-containing protein [Candidatus Gastranaerophilaceae bacterium]